MPAAAVSGAAAIYGASQNRAGARDQANAAREGLDWTKQVYGDAQGNFSPYLGLGQTGATGLQALAGGDYSGFMNSPDFKARVQFANEQFNSGAAARFRLFSGGAQNDRDELNQRLAATGLNDYRSSLMGLAGLGQQAAGTLGGIGTQTAQQVQNGYNNIGNANASGRDSNAQLGGALGNLFGQWYNSRPPVASSYGSGYGTGSGGSLGNWGAY